MAEHYGMCFGVRDAIELAMDLTERQPLTIYGDLVHNPDVVKQLDDAGARRVRRQNDIETQTVLLTAHGTSNRLKLQLRESGHELHDATCPLVERAHRALDKLVAEDYFPIIIGKSDHVEVEGMTGDLEDYIVLNSEEDFPQIDEQFPDGCYTKLGIVAQTTWPIEKARALVKALTHRYPQADVRFIDTVCQPTKERQQSLCDLVKVSDVIIVVGGPASNNSRKLVELANRLGCPAYRVSNADELAHEWFQNAETVGLTAGTSTPDDVIEQVRERLQMM